MRKMQSVSFEAVETQYTGPHPPRARPHFAATESEATARNIAEFLREHVFKLHGFPREIVADQDPRWVSQFYKALFELVLEVLCLLPFNRKRMGRLKGYIKFRKTTFVIM